MKSYFVEEALLDADKIYCSDPVNSPRFNQTLNVNVLLFPAPDGVLDN